MHNRVVALVVLVLLSGAAAQSASDSIRPGAEPLDDVDLVIGGNATAVAYWFRFSVTEPLDMYAKNSFTGPHVNNGTAGESGWFVTFGIVGPGLEVEAAPTTDDSPVELGTVQADTPYRFTVEVHVPADAQTELTTYSMAFILAAHAVLDGSGSGSAEDPSERLEARLAIVEPPPEPEPEQGTTNETEAEGESDPGNETGDTPTTGENSDVNGADDEAGPIREALQTDSPLVALVMVSVVVSLGALLWGLRSRALRIQQEKRLRRLEASMARKRRPPQ